MASIQSGKSRGSLSKAPPAPMAKAPEAAAPRAGRTVAHKYSTPAMHSTEWRQMIARAAYFRAEARGFAGGSPEQDWFEAEAELMARVGNAQAA